MSSSTKTPAADRSHGGPGSSQHKTCSCGKIGTGAGRAYQYASQPGIGRRWRARQSPHAQSARKGERKSDCPRPLDPRQPPRLLSGSRDTISAVRRLRSLRCCREPSNHLHAAARVDERARRILPGIPDHEAHGQPSHRALRHGVPRCERPVEDRQLSQWRIVNRAWEGPP